jgi:hypothetical protein
MFVEMRDTGIVYARAGFVNQTQLKQDVDAARQVLSPQEVVTVAYSVGEDWTDDPAIFFRIVLTDAASARDRLHDVATRVSSTVSDLVRPLEKWGLFPYFSFRSFSEQKTLNDPKWS